MMSLGKCVFEPNRNKLPEFAPEPASTSRNREVELPVYFTAGKVLGPTFGEYLNVHETVLSLWDRNVRRYRNGKYVSGSRQYCTVYLQDIRVYIRWRRVPSFTSGEDVLIGKPLLTGKIWRIKCYSPEKSVLEKIRKCWDSKLKKFKNSVFLRKDGNRIWVYLRDLKLCVGWIQGLGSRIFGAEDRKEEMNVASESYDFYEYGLTLRRKINNSYGCW